MSRKPADYAEAKGVEQHPSFMLGVVGTAQLSQGVDFFNMSARSCAISPTWGFRETRNKKSRCLT
jgi:hypothetical protein